MRTLRHDPLNVADVFGLGASLIDQYDAAGSGQPDVMTQHQELARTLPLSRLARTVGGQFVLGWENVCGGASQLTVKFRLPATRIPYPQEPLQLDN